MTTRTGRGTIATPARQEQALGSLEESLALLRSLVEADDVEAARSLAPQLLERWPESPEARHWARVLAPPKATALRGETSRCVEREREWLRQHRHEYPGCWLAVYEDRLVAADPDLQTVYKIAREALGDRGAVIYFQAGDPA